MTFAEKLKSIRKQMGISQELLAEKIGVSRQAVTKWETDAGIPDIENILSISNLFNISIDELLSNEIAAPNTSEYLFESITEYDIDKVKSYDMKLGGAKKFVLSGYQGEKIRIRLVSNNLSTLQNDFKVKIDGVTEATAKKSVSIFVQIPVSYISHIECEISTESMEIHSLDCEDIELDIKTPHIILEDISGKLKINCNLDMEVLCNSLNGEIDINQISATSRIRVPINSKFTAISKGIGTSIYYEKNGQKTESFDFPNSDNIIKLNGIKSELVIYTKEERR